MRLFFICSVLVLNLFSCRNEPTSSSPVCTRIQEMLFASAIADAMGGPLEGRSTNVSQEFLRNGGWIDTFLPYSPWHQHHWNVYQRQASPGTYTDDDRMRLSLVRFMIDYFATGARGNMTRRFLAECVFRQYRQAYQQFQQIDRRWRQNHSREAKDNLHNQRRERFLHLWFCWELAKTATSVTIPENPKIFTPPYRRVSDDPDHPDYSLHWHLEPIPPRPVLNNMKSSFHQNTYASGQEMPLGLIHLLPAAFLFPHHPQQAFHYVQEIDFFDIGQAALFPAVACAIIADLLGGRRWSEIENRILQNGLDDYRKANTGNSQRLAKIEAGLRKGILLAKRFRPCREQNDRKKALDFLFALHRNFATSETFMCSVEEMLFVPVALVAYAGNDINFLIELGVNYGRDNDTLASIAAFIGAAQPDALPLRADWKDRVQKANPQRNIARLVRNLCRYITP